LRPEVELAPVETTAVVPLGYKTKLKASQVQMIKDNYAKGASDDELRVFLFICERTALDPFSRQIHLVPRWDNKLGREIRITQVGIDGFRAVAERTGAYAGSDDAVFEGEEGKQPAKATVTVYKMVQGQRCAFTASARWAEYYPGEKQGFMWRSKPHVMLSKCAEALALRKAFPQVLSGIYAEEELTKGSGSGPKDANRTPIEIARGSIPLQTDPAVLEDYLAKIEKSNKYTDDEKGEVRVLIKAQIKKLLDERDAREAAAEAAGQNAA